MSFNSRLFVKCPQVSFTLDNLQNMLSRLNETISTLKKVMGHHFLNIVLLLYLLKVIYY